MSPPAQSWPSLHAIIMRQLLFLILVIFLTFCSTKQNDWETLDFGVFKLKAPIGWTIIKKQGIDSYFGGLTNGKDSLWFDYGWYSVDLTGEATYTHKYAKDTVNGLSARVMISEIPGKGYISLYIPKVTDKNKFTIWGENINDVKTVLKIYKSAVFNSSDTSKNPLLTDSNFIYVAHGNGKTLFQINCASCHSIFKDLSGPALTDVIDKRSNDWLFKFLTKRKSIMKDSMYHSLRRKYEFECQEFSTFSKEDVDLIVDYIRNMDD